MLLVLGLLLLLLLPALLRGVARRVIADERRERPCPEGVPAGIEGEIVTARDVGDMDRDHRLAGRSASEASRAIDATCCRHR